MSVWEDGVKILRTGVMGCADIAARMVIPSVNSIDSIELVAAASRKESKARYFGDKFNCEQITGYENLLAREDIDAVYMPLPTGLHEEWILKSLEAGKHVLAEKSLAMNPGSAEKIIEKAKEKELLVMENYMFPHHSQYAFIDKLLEDGEIGEIRFVKSSFAFPPLDKDNFRYNPELGGGSLLDAGGYTVKSARMFLGDDLVVGGAFLKMDENTKVDVWGGAILRDNRDRIAELAFGFDNYYQCKLEISGSEGMIVSDRAFTAPPALSPKIVLERRGHRQEFLLPPDNHFINILKKFRAAVLNKEYDGHWSDCLVQAKMMDEIRRAGENG